MNITRHKQIQSFWDEQSNVYRDAQWIGSNIAKFDYAKTRKALLRSLNPTKTDKILEIGCGPGTWTGLIAGRCSKIMAIDISKKMIENAKKHIHDNNVTFINSNFMHHAIGEKFDKIFSVRAFEYISAKEEFFRKVYFLLNPGGELILITKTKDSVWDLYKRLKKSLRLYNKNDFDEVRLYSWYDNIPPYLIKILLKRNRFSIKNISPVIIRFPIFMNGNDEIPFVPEKLEHIALRIFDIFSENLSEKSTQVPLLLSESYIIHAIKKGHQN